MKSLFEINNLHRIFVIFLVSLISPCLSANPSIAVLDFELRDLTLMPGIPQEVARTASVKPLLDEELSKSGYLVVNIPMKAQIEATAGVGYLFDHHDVAAQLARQYHADFVLVGRLHKPSFLFAYLMGHLINAKEGQLVADYLSEIKGSDKKLTRKGVESLVDKINITFSRPM